MFYRKFHLFKVFQIFCITFLLGYQSGITDDQPSIQYLFPMPGSTHHPKETVIIVRFRNLAPDGIANFDDCIALKGGVSDSYPGATVISTDARTLIFKPDNDFQFGDSVTVRISPVKLGASHCCLDTTFHFIIGFESVSSMNEDVNTTWNASAAIATELQDPAVINGISIPSDFPWADITINDNPDPGYIFISHFDGSFYNIIMDNTGAPVWYRKTRAFGADFKVQSNGLITVRTLRGYSPAGFIAMDNTYTIVDTFYAPPGYTMNNHDILLLDNGHYLCIADDYRRMDLSEIVEGGHPDAYVKGNSVAEMDAGDNPVSIWRCWDYFTDITDAEHLDLTTRQIDYVHMNAVALDLDGNILISSRQLSEITKINRETGDIIWRLGGANSQFEWTNDTDGISYQHDIRALGEGTYTVFDNGNYHNPPYSRALEFVVDTSSGTATRIWEYRESDRFSRFGGNVQRLPNGNTLINWAMPEYPKPIEVRPDGSKAFEMDFVNPSDCYRIFRFPWEGRAASPYLSVESGIHWITLLYNKFGDPNVQYYRIYGGARPHPDEIMATSTNPFIHLSDLTNHSRYYFRVTAVDRQGMESAFSNEASIRIQFTEPGENLVSNGDFSQGHQDWTWNVSDAQASRVITDVGELHFQIEAAGTETWQIQAIQTNIPLIKDNVYRFEYDAYAASGRTVEFEVVRDGDPAINYSQMGSTWLGPSPQHFTHEFVMDHPSESEARIVLNAGGSEADVFIDNISLMEISSDAPGTTELRTQQFLLKQNCPNPFNPVTTIHYTIAERSEVTLSILNVRGELVSQPVNRIHTPGRYNQLLDASNLASGIYVFVLDVRSLQGRRLFRKSKKMTILK